MEILINTLSSVIGFGQRQRAPVRQSIHLTGNIKAPIIHDTLLTSTTASMSMSMQGETSFRSSFSGYSESTHDQEATTALLLACAKELQRSTSPSALGLLQSLESHLQDGHQRSPIRKVAKTAKKLKQFVACNLCRHSKAKCVMSTEKPGQCQRCLVAGFPCVFAAHKRGRKRWGNLPDPVIRD